MKFYTIGVNGKTPIEFFALLRKYGIKTLIDIRKAPQVGYRAHLSYGVVPGRINIQTFMKLNRITYVWAKYLSFSKYQDWNMKYQTQLEDYSYNIVTYMQRFPGPFCLVGSKNDYQMCHRNQLATFLVRHGFKLDKHI